MQALALIDFVKSTHPDAQFLISRCPYLLRLTRFLLIFAPEEQQPQPAPQKDDQQRGKEQAGAGVGLYLHRQSFYQLQNGNPKTLAF